MGAVLFLYSKANLNKSDDVRFNKEVSRHDAFEDKSLIDRTEAELLKAASKRGDIASICSYIFGNGSRFYSDLLAKKPVGERYTDSRINKLYDTCSNGLNDYSDISFSVFSITVNGQEYSIMKALSRIELPSGECDVTLKAVLNFRKETYSSQCVEEKVTFKKTFRIHLEEGYNFLQFKGTVHFNKTVTGKQTSTHIINVFVIEVPNKMDFTARLLTYDEFNGEIIGNQFDIPYPGNKYFKYGYENDTLLSDEERETELKKARLALSSKGGVTTKTTTSSNESKKPEEVAVNNNGASKTVQTQESKAQPTIEKKPHPKPDRVGIYGRDSQLSKAMQIMNDSSKEAVDDLNASYNELMSVLRSNKPKYTPTPKKAEPVEERPDPMWEAEKRAYEEQLRQEEEEKRKKEAAIEAERRRTEEAEKAKIEAAERRKAIEAAEKEKQFKKAEEERKERDRRIKEERLAKTVENKNPPKNKVDTDPKKDAGIYEKYKDYFIFKGDTLVEYKGLSGTVKVPEDIKKIDNKFFKNKNIRRLIIEAPITILSEQLLAYSDIEELTIPKSVKRIEKHCFKECKRLRSVKGGDVSFIGEEAFLGCENVGLSELHLSPTGVQLGKSCFKNCKSLGYFNVTCKIVPEGCFENCGKLRTLHLTDTETISKNAFFNCGSLEKIIMSATQKANEKSVGASIKESAFEKCRALKYISIPSKSISIENGAFKDCDSLCLVNFSYNPTLSEKGDISGKCEFSKAFISCPSLKKIIYKGDKDAVKALDPSGKCPFKIKNKLKEKDMK